MRPPFLIALLAALPCAASAAAPEPSASAARQEPQARFDTWRVASFLEDAGLEERSVNDIDFQRDGTVWCAASDGLYRYDGYLWERYASEHGLPSDTVRCVRVTRDGSIWVGTDRGAGRFDGGRFQPAAEASQLGSRSVRRIVEDDDGTLWFCCDRWADQPGPGGLVRMRDGRWRLFDESDGLPSDSVTDFFRDSHGRGFVLTDGDLIELEEESFTQPLAGMEGPAGAPLIWALFERPDGALVAASFGGHFVWREGVGWRRGEGALVDRMSHPRLLQTSDGLLVTCTQEARARFARVDEGELVPLTSAFPGSSTGVRVLAEAPDGAIWAGGGNLLVRWQRRGGEWRRFADRPWPQLRDARGRIWCERRDYFEQRRRVVSVLEAAKWTPIAGSRQLLGGSDGHVFYETDEGLVVVGLEGDELHRFEDIGAPDLNSVVRDGAGHLWAEAGNGFSTSWIVHYDGVSWRRVDPVTDEPTRVLRLRANTDAGAWVVLGGRHSELCRLVELGTDGVEEVELPRPIASRGPSISLLEDSAGRLWLCGFVGLYCREDGEWRRIEEIPGRHVIAGFERHDGLWFGVSGATGGSAGLVRLRDGEWRHFPVVLRQFLGEDPNGSFFFSTNAGLCIVPPGADRPSLLTVPSELSVESAVLAENGDLWIGLGEFVDLSRTERGALVYRPDGVPPETIAVPLATHVSSGEELQVQVRGVERFKPRSRRTNLRVSTRTSGSEWSAFEPLKDETVVLSDLDVGDHVLHVRVQDEGLDVDPTPATVRFSVLPVPVQARWWFWPAMGAIFVVIATLSALTGRAKRRLAQQAATLSETVALRTAELQMSERKYRNLYEQSHDAVCLTGLDGTITDANGTALDLLGFEREEMIGTPPDKLFFAPDDLGAILGELERGAPVRDRPCTVHTREGLPLEVRVSVNRRRDEDGRPTGTQIILRDVTTETRLEERLRQTQKMEAVGRLAGGVAHDFNNLLTAIVGYGELLAIKTAHDPNVRRDVEMVLEAAERAQALTGQIQTFSRGQIVEPRIVDLNEVVEGMQKLLQRIIGEDVLLTAKFDRDLANVRMDPGQLEQVIVNLAVNARDAMPDGGRLTLQTSMVTLQPETARHAELEPGEYVRLRVADTGTGIDPQTREKIFEPFFTTKGQGKGTGLGLATVYGIVRQGGGGIDVQSTQGQGASFRIYLPACAEEVADGDGVLTPVEVAGGDETVLVVEDEAAIRGLIERLLLDAGYRVITAPDAESALARARLFSGPIHLLLTDIVLPGRKGWELSDILQAGRPGLRTLFMSGYAEADPTGRPRWEATEPVLKKPFVPSMLRRRVREILDQDTSDAEAALRR